MLKYLGAGLLAATLALTGPAAAQTKWDMPKIGRAHV